jgi:ATP-dependent DNA helicase DinG
MQHAAAPLPVSLPDCPAVFANTLQAAILTSEGEIQTLSHDKARLMLHKKAALVCHAPFTRARLAHGSDQNDEFYTYDVLELYAFLYPTEFCVPTPVGLCNTLGLSPPRDFEDMPMAVSDIARALLSGLRGMNDAARSDILRMAQAMGMNGKGWGWTPYVFEAAGETYDSAVPINSKAAMNVWKTLPEWAEDAPAPPPAHHGVEEQEAEARLKQLLGQGAETRDAQREYTKHVAKAFAPVVANPSGDRPAPHVILAEAGTGIGKTLGYLAPASVWAEKNDGAVWISTYTKNLQRQIDGELDRLYPQAELKDAHVAIRKGRENYLCLLNLEDKATSAEAARHPNHMIAAGIMARWTAATKDGDLTGADFPGWLPGLLGYQHTSGLADRRGECIFSACDHYHKCFVEKSVRKAKRARIVVANHALVMIHSAMNGGIVSSEETLPTRYIFDEGHHMFDAADSAFSAHLTARETRDLRRWILGAEGGKRTRARGLSRRTEDLIAGDHKAEQALQKILMAAQGLTMDGWTKRLKNGEVSGPYEIFFQHLYAQVFARANGRDGPFSLETEVHPVDDAVLKASITLKAALIELQKPMQDLATLIYKKLGNDDGEMEADTRKRLDAVAMSLDRRARMTLGAWIQMLDGLGGEATLSNPPPHSQTDLLPDKAQGTRAGLAGGGAQNQYVDWMQIERIDGRAIDIGFYRHHVDPMEPFAAALSPHVHGVVATSATLCDQSEDEDQNWSAARARTGASYLAPSSYDAKFTSPFDYKTNSKVIIINDVRKDDLSQVAGAYRALFKASGGSALGLFTAIGRLRAVHNKIASDLERSNIPLYSQHIDDIDAGTLVDIFRDDEAACLLGTDAIRDGVDVPGASLKLLVFDRVPWPRPTILHKARREAFGKRRYDEMLTRLKLKQAYGRLIRRNDDKGVFVMLDSMLPSRLHGAFPPDVDILKIGLNEAVQEIETFLKESSPAT